MALCRMSSVHCGLNLLAVPGRLVIVSSIREHDDRCVDDCDVVESPCDFLWVDRCELACGRLNCTQHVLAPACCELNLWGGIYSGCQCYQ